MLPTPHESDEIARFVARSLDETRDGALSRPMATASAVEDVVDRLLTAIALGEFVPGERLPGERMLAQMLGVGRSTVHEAMQRLRNSGVVTVKRGRTGGAFVCSDWSQQSAEAVTRTMTPRWHQLEQLLDLREAVEGMVARTAAKRRTAEDIGKMRAALAHFAAATNPAQEHAADAAIHRAITEATGNPQFRSLARDVLAAIAFGLPLEPYSRHVFERALQEHTALVEAVANGDADEAARIAELHFRITAETMREVYGRGANTVESRNNTE